jgi:hypothetical protein
MKRYMLYVLACAANSRLTMEACILDWITLDKVGVGEVHMHMVVDVITLVNAGSDHYNKKHMSIKRSIVVIKKRVLHTLV